MMAMKTTNTVQADGIYAANAEAIETAVRLRLRSYPRLEQREVVQDIWHDLLAEVQQGKAIPAQRIRTVIERHVKRCKRSTRRAFCYQSIDRMLETQEGVDGCLAELPTAPGMRPDTMLIADTLISEARRTIAAELSPRQREVFRSRVLLDESVRLTAKRLNLTKDVVKNDMTRGLSRLRVASIDLGHGEETAEVVQICLDFLVASFKEEP